MKNLGRLAVIAVVGFVLLSGCQTFMRQVPQRTSPNMDFLYGRMNLASVGDMLMTVGMIHYPYKSIFPYSGSGSDIPFKVLPDGTFYAANVKPGKYVLWFFQGHGLSEFNRLDTYYMTSRKPRHFTAKDAIDFQPATLDYLGSWKVKIDKKSSNSKNFKFSINQDQQVSEADILREILPYTKGTAWNAMIRTKLGLPPAPQGS